MAEAPASWRWAVGCAGLLLLVLHSPASFGAEPECLIVSPMAGPSRDPYVEPINDHGEVGARAGGGVGDQGAQVTVLVRPSHCLPPPPPSEAPPVDPTTLPGDAPEAPRVVVLP